MASATATATLNLCHLGGTTLSKRRIVDETRAAFKQLRTPNRKQVKAVLALCDELERCIKGDTSGEQLDRLRKATMVVLDYTAKGERQQLQVLLSIVGTKIDLRGRVFLSAVYASSEPLHCPA